MSLVDSARKYAQGHPQEVQLRWLDHRVAVCSALEAVVLCSVPHVAALIVCAVADDKTLENMLNHLIDGA